VILIDTGALIALLDDRDRLNRRALSDFRRLGTRRLFTCSPVLVEACFALPARFQRERLGDFLRRFDVQPHPVESERALWDEVLAWMYRYAEHEPDFADAWLAVLSQRERRLRVWTYDREFARVWRRPDGSRIPLAVRDPG
jgi:predicted nucleic acid-binding protein